MKRYASFAVVAGFAGCLLAPNPVLSGPPSGGRSHGANTWEAKHATYTPAVYAPPTYVAPTAPPAVTGGFYYAPDAAPEAGDSAVLAVRVPANAEIWLNDYKTKLTGPAREFISPSLSREMNYRYHVRVRWLENGREVTQEREVPVAPGARTSVRFGS
jgi:uncharacterized protein (TIGR03000 family)